MDKKRGYGLVLLSFLTITLLIGFIGVVSAETFVVKDSQKVETLAGSFTSLFTDWSKGTVGMNVAKVIFFIIVVLFLYLIFSFLPFFEERLGITFIFALLVGFLSTAYLVPADVYSLLISYNALGLTLLSIIPLIVLVGFSYRAFTTGSVPMVMLQLFAWGLFAIYSIYRFIYDLAIAKEGSPTANVILLLVAIVALVFFLGNRQIRRWVMKNYRDVVSEEAGKQWDRAVSTIEKAAAAEEKLAAKTRNQKTKASKRLRGGW